MKNESKTAPKQNQVKPRGPHGNRVEQKVGFWRLLGSLGSPWALFCSTWARLGRFFVPLWVALDPIFRCWWLLDGLGSSTNAFLERFWSHFASKHFEKTMPKQVLFRIRKTLIFATRLQNNKQMSPKSPPNRTMESNATPGGQKKRPR